MTTRAMARQRSAVKRSEAKLSSGILKRQSDILTAAEESERSLIKRLVGEIAS